MQTRRITAAVPHLRISQIDGGVRLGLEGFSYAEGATLQEAADELVRRMLVIAMAFRASGVGPIYSECRADPGALAFIWKLGEIAAGGGDIRDLLFTPTPKVAPAGSTHRDDPPSGQTG